MKTENYLSESLCEGNSAILRKNCAKDCSSPGLLIKTNRQPTETRFPSPPPFWCLLPSTVGNWNRAAGAREASNRSALLFPVVWTQQLSVRTGFQYHSPHGQWRALFLKITFPLWETWCLKFVEIVWLMRDMEFAPILNDVLMRSSREGNRPSRSHWPSRISLLFKG